MDTTQHEGTGRVGGLSPLDSERDPIDPMSAAMEPEADLPSPERLGALEERLGHGLGWFSIGLGLLEVAAPARMARLIGAGEEHASVLRLLGMREIAHGIGILARPRPAGAVWSRVGGDAIDLAFLGAAARSPEANRVRLAAAGAAVLGVAALDGLVAQMLSGPPTRTTRDGTVLVRRSIAIGLSPDEVYAFWRRLENLPRFMEHLESVRETGPSTSHWVAKGPAGSRVEWYAELVADEPGRLVSWRTRPESDVHHHGSVRFERAPGDRGTHVTVELEYRPPAGPAGVAIAKLFGEEPAQQVQDDLRRLKQILETGHVVRSEATLRGTKLRRQLPGQPPPADAEIPTAAGAPSGLHH